MKPLNPQSIAAPFGGYSHGIAGHTVVVTSGQLGIAADGSVPEGAEAQARICFDNLRAILASAGLDFSDVLRFNAYVTAREDMAAYMRVRDAVVADLAVKPASTLMIVSGFTRAEFRVEVEATAQTRA